MIPKSLKSVREEFPRQRQQVVTVLAEISFMVDECRHGSVSWQILLEDGLVCSIFGDPGSEGQRAGSWLRSPPFTTITTNLREQWIQDSEPLVNHHKGSKFCC